MAMSLESLIEWAVSWVPREGDQKGGFAKALAEELLAWREPGTRSVEPNVAHTDGDRCLASGHGSIAIGIRAKALADGAVALGTDAVAMEPGAVALGRRLLLPADGSFWIDGELVAKGDPRIVDELCAAVRQFFLPSGLRGGGHG